MDNLATLLAMGGYGLYVWSSYALAVVSLAGVVIGLLLQKRHYKKQLPPQAAVPAAEAKEEQ